MIERIFKLNCDKFSFGKNSEFFEMFCKNINAFSMFTNGFGFDIPETFSMENKLRAVFRYINLSNGRFIFNISGVDIISAIKGFENFDVAFGNNMITEWELSVILENEDYYNKTIFHNGFTEFKYVKNKGFKIKWN
jgi:hypothetical protein